jgi:hypothetical protein
LNYAAELSAGWDQCNKDDLKLWAMITCVYAQVFPQVVALEETFITLLARIFLHACNGTTGQVKKCKIIFFIIYLPGFLCLSYSCHPVILSVVVAER